MFKFFNAFIFFDRSETGIDVNIKILRKYKINRLHEAVPPSISPKTDKLSADNQNRA